MRSVLPLFVAALVPVLCYSNVAAPRLQVNALAAKPTPKATGDTSVAAAKFPPLQIKAAYGIENEYQLNLGKSIDSLRRDYPRMLRAPPDFSIFTDNILLKGAASKHRLEGIEAYTRVFDALRFIRNTTMVHDEVGARIVVSDGKIRVRWNAKLTMTAPFAALPGLARDEEGRPIVYVDGVSVYDVNSKGYLSKHQLENIVVTPPELQGAVDLALFWPGRFNPRIPVPAVAPFLHHPSSLEMAISGGKVAVPGAHVAVSVASRLDQSAHVHAAGPPGRKVAQQRSPVPVAMERESPMERAARERAEDAEAAQRLRELRAPPPSLGASEGASSFLSSFLQPPQACESNYDCEQPLVCCDLIVASVCCSSGMMIGPPPRNAGLQGQPIPIPVPVDDGLPTGARGGGSMY